MENPTEISGTSSEGETAHLSFARQIGLVSRTIFRSPVGKTLTVLMAAIVAVVAATAYGQIRLNGWNKPFYDALSRRDLRDFLFQLGVFFLIAGVLLALNVAQRWLVETLELKLRQGLVLGLLQDWMLPRRAFWLANAGSMGVNPDQRIHEDARKLCELSADLGVGLLQASILFFTFAGILWGLVERLHFSHRRPGLHGSRLHGVGGDPLCRAPARCSATGSGRGLIGRNAERYAREADLRFSLVRVNEHVDDISLAEGEADERRRIELHLDNVLARDAPHRQGPRQSHLGHRRLRLGHDSRARSWSPRRCISAARFPSAA